MRVPLLLLLLLKMSKLDGSKAKLLLEIIKKDILPKYNLRLGPSKTDTMCLDRVSQQGKKGVNEKEKFHWLIYNFLTKASKIKKARILLMHSVFGVKIKD